MCAKCRNFYKYGERYPGNFYRVRKKIFERDDYKCQCCGVKPDDLHTNSLVCHHIDVDRSNNSLSNLITLCVQCHSSLHSKYDKPTLRSNLIWSLFAKEPQFGQFGKTLVYKAVSKVVSSERRKKERKSVNRFLRRSSH
jgi:hypothetical protein